ncbi:MAG: Rap1a/Tai family immunity protein, partial [Thermodesulfobacteriota bacterium]
CPPKSTQNPQISKVVATYLSQHPGLLNDPAEILVIDALTAHFPCTFDR